MAGSSGNSPAARRARNSSIEPTPVLRKSRSRRASAAAELGDDPAHEVRLLAVGDRADVRQARQHRQPAAAEVEDVHAELGRAVGQREGQQHRPQRAGLARPRPADHREVTRGTREVDGQRIAALQVGPVDHADGDAQGLRAQGHRETTSGPDGGPAEQLVERRGRAQRGQPHAVRRRARARPSRRSSCRAPWAPPVPPRALAPRRRRRNPPARPGIGGRGGVVRNAAPSSRPPWPGRSRWDRRRTRPGTAPARRCPWRGTPSRARTATGGRPAPPGPRATRQRRRCAARCGRTGASPARAAGPRRAAARPAAGACRASARAARS